ncbi:tRNA modification GTPase MnmE, partial [Smittium mucronatum]
KRAKESDIVALVFEAQDWLNFLTASTLPHWENDAGGRSLVDAFVLLKMNEIGAVPFANSIIVFNKSDQVLDHSLFPTNDPRVSLISCVDQSGWSLFLDRLTANVKQRVESDSSEPAFISRERHRQLLSLAVNHLREFNRMDESTVVEAAEELRLAADCIGQISGRIDTQRVLDHIFSQFCIGK